MLLRDATLHMAMAKANQMLFLVNHLTKSACHAAAGGTAAVYNSSCYSNLFLSDANQTSTAANKPGIVCPTMQLQRPANQSNLTTAYFYNYVAAEPLLYSYEGCTCTAPLVPNYFVDASGSCSCSSCIA